MKRWMVYLVILVVIAIAFSIGYYQSKQAKTKKNPLLINLPEAITTEMNSSIPGKTIVFTYQLQTTLNSTRLLTAYKKQDNKWIEGNGLLNDFLDSICPKQDPLETLSISSELNQPYYFYLRYPTGETKEKLWRLVSEALSIQSIDTVSLLKYYEMTQNGQPMKLKMVDARSEQGWSTNKDNTQFTFTGELTPNIKEYLLFYQIPGKKAYQPSDTFVLEDATGLKGRYTGTLPMPDTFEEAKQVLLDEAGIVITPKEKTIIVHKIEFMGYAGRRAPYSILPDMILI